MERWFAREFVPRMRYCGTAVQTDGTPGGHLLDGLWNRKLLSRIDVDKDMRIEGLPVSAAARPRAGAAARAPRFEIHHFLLLAAIAALLFGVFWLSTASRTGLGFEAGSHLRSLARAHRVAESDGPAIHVAYSAFRIVRALPEPVLLVRFLPFENGAGKAVTTLAGSRISRGPPARVA